MKGRHRIFSLILGAMLMLALMLGCESPPAMSFQRNRNTSGPGSNSSAPQGATARCRDGSYSFSQPRRGTCSHHGEVAEWLRPDIPD